MRWAVILLGIAGCFDPAVQPGAPCGENGACPGSLVCTNGTCERPGGSSDAADASLSDVLEIDAMIDANPTPSDTDGDGLPNLNDNCPNQFNSDQHDEDDDSLGDVCDNCPHIANADQANVMDNDSVGDVCDPNPTLGGDSIARFLPMHAVPGQTSTLGTWQQIGDAFVHTDTGDSALIIQSGPWPKATVMISAKVESANIPFVWIAATVGEAAAGYHFCGFEDEIPTSGPDFHRAVWGPGTGTNWTFGGAVEHYSATRLSGAFSIRLHGNADSDVIECTVVDNRGEVSTGPLDLPLSPGHVGIRGDGISYSVNYIVVFTR